MRKKKRYKTVLPKYNIYRIILTNNGRKLRILCSDKTEQAIMKRFNKLLKDNKKEIMFAKKWNVEEHVMQPSDYEIVILKLRDENESEVTQVKDAYGRYTNYTTNSQNWIVIDRAQYDIEESFWVYGYHPTYQRKDYKWIMDNFVHPDAKNKSVFKSIQVFLNKVVFEINGKLEMVICKNRFDSVRLYNQIQEECVKKKYKYIAFMGRMDDSKYRMEWARRIMELTNWDLTKVTRISTRE